MLAQGGPTDSSKPGIFLGLYFFPKGGDPIGIPDVDRAPAPGPQPKSTILNHGSDLFRIDFCRENASSSAALGYTEGAYRYVVLLHYR